MLLPAQWWRIKSAALHWGHWEVKGMDECPRKWCVYFRCVWLRLVPAARPPYTGCGVEKIIAVLFAVNDGLH